MTYSDILSLMDDAITSYVEDEQVKLRSGKYSSGDNWKDGYIGMLIESIQDQRPEDNFYPLTHDKVRKLIFTFNKMTFQRVPDIWDDVES